MEVRRGFAALLCVALLGLAGCTDDESSADPGDPTSNAAPSPTATESGEPSIPPEARGSDEASAKAFTMYFFQTLTASMNSGEVAAVAALSSGACTSCTALQDNIRGTFANGGYAVTRGWKPTSFEPAETASGIAFDLRVRLGDEKFYNADGKVTHHFEGDDSRRMVIFLKPNGSSWQVSRLDIAR
jgi:hypothetical protein